MPRVQGHQNWYSQLSNTQIHKYTYTNTQIQLMTKCQEYQTYAIFLNSCWFKDVKNDIPNCPKWSDPTTDQTSDPTSDPTSKSLLRRLLHCPPRFIIVWGGLSDLEIQLFHIHSFSIVFVIAVHHRAMQKWDSSCRQVCTRRCATLQRYVTRKLRLLRNLDPIEAGEQLLMLGWSCLPPVCLL